jgi:hypothetical protein
VPLSGIRQSGLIERGLRIHSEFFRSVSEGFSALIASVGHEPLPAGLFWFLIEVDVDVHVACQDARWRFDLVDPRGVLQVQ